MDWATVGQKCIKEAFVALSGSKTVRLLDNGINPHTDADLISHAAIEKVLRDSGIPCELISEESDQMIALNGGGAARVIIDPIDGTAMFMRGEKYFSSVGMIIIENNQPAYSFVGDIVSGDIYYCDERFAYKNGGRIINPKETVSKPVLAGWAPYSPRMEKFFEKFSKLPKKEYLMFNFGAMLQCAKITDGRYDACFEIIPTKLQEFAGAIIAWRAGGEISTLEGEPILWDINVKQTMLVSRNKELHQKLLKFFN